MPDQAKQDRQKEQQRQQQQQQQQQQQAPLQAKGPGVQAVQGLLQQGVSDPAKYARVIREYPQEKAGVLQAVGSSPLGAGFAQEVAKEAEGLDLSVEDKRLSYVGDENYLVADQKRKGAEFKAGATTGTLNKDGLTTRTDIDGDKGDREIVGKLGQDKNTKHIAGSVDHVDGDTSVGVGMHIDPKKPGENHGVDVHGKTSVGKGQGDAKLGYDREGGQGYAVGELGYKDSTDAGRLKLKYGDADNFDVGLSGSHKTGGATYSGNAGYGEKDGVGTARGGVGYAKDGLNLGLSGRYTDGDNYQVDGKASKKLGSGDTLYGGLGYGEKGGEDTLSGYVGRKDATSDTRLSGTYTDQDKYGLNLTDTRKHGSDLSTQAALGYNVTGGEGALTGSLKGQYKTDDFVASGGLGAQYDKDGLSYNADIDATGTLKEGSLYYEGFGGVKGGGALDEPQYHMGGGLVLTPNEKMALTISGAVDQNGGFDTRLQFDLFKKKVDNARGLSERKKQSAVSIFAGYRQGMDGGVLDNQFGGGRYSHDEGQAYVGVGFRF